MKGIEANTEKEGKNGKLMWREVADESGIFRMRVRFLRCNSIPIQCLEFASLRYSVPLQLNGLPHSKSRFCSIFLSAYEVN